MTSTSGTLAVDTALLQRRVTGSCGAGAAVASVAADGTVTCQALWSTRGNAGTAAGSDFAGTTDNQPFELRANSLRVARFEPTTLISGIRPPNVVLGDETNSTTVGKQGASIGGGHTNSVVDSFGVVAGGQENTGGPLASVLGGFRNAATGLYGAVGGGRENKASQYASAIAGRIWNTSSGNYSTVGGGLTNVASNTGSTVPGGYWNTASGVGSLAAGTYANAQFDGCFVWSDTKHQPTQISCSAANQFVAQASGGVTFWTNSAATVGVSVAAGGASWASASDRNTKKDFEPVKPSDVLQKVVAMPISTWAYKTEQGATHMGPMAQDFYAAFKLGQDDKHIVTVDADGVALAAIQGLNEKLEAEKCSPSCPARAPEPASRRHRSQPPLALAPMLVVAATGPSPRGRQHRAGLWGAQLLACCAQGLPFQETQPHLPGAQ